MAYLGKPFLGLALGRGAAVVFPVPGQTQGRHHQHSLKTQLVGIGVFLDINEGDKGTSYI